MQVDVKRSGQRWQGQGQTRQAPTRRGAGDTAARVTARPWGAVALAVAMGASLTGGPLAGCGDDDGGGPADAAVDLGGPDAGGDAAVDAGPGDAGPGDAGPGDAGPDDAGPGDAGPDDAGSGDAGPDDAGDTDTGATNRAPTVRLAGLAASVRVGVAVEVTCDAADEDGDTLSLEVSASSGAVVTGQWTPAAVGLATVTCRVTDGRGGEATDTREVFVFPASLRAHFPLDGTGANVGPVGGPAALPGSGVVPGPDRRGRAGGGLLFDGTGGLVVSDAAALGFESLSIVVWVRRDVGTRSGIVRKASGTATNYELVVNDSGAPTFPSRAVYVHTNDIGVFSQLGPTVPAPSPFAMLAVTVTPTEIRFYVDGIFTISGPNPGRAVTGAGELTIGQAGSATFRGALDELMIFEGALDPDDVAALAAF